MTPTFGLAFGKACKRAAAWMALSAGIGMGSMAHAAGPTKLVLQSGSSAPSMEQIALVVAEQAGYFKGENVELKIQYANGASMAAQLVATNSADIGSITLEPVITGYQNGIRGKFFYGTTNRLIYYIGVPQDSGIKTAADLKGKKLGVASMGSSSLVVAQSILREAGVPKEAVTIVPVGGGASAMAALSAKQVDAVSLWHSAYGALEKSGMKLNYIAHPTVAGVGNDGFFTSQQTLATKKDALAGFSRAIAKASVFLAVNPEAAIRMYWKYNPGAKVGDNDADALAKGVTELRYYAESVKRQPKAYGSYDLQGVQRYQQVFKDEGRLPEVIPADQLIDSSLLPRANDFDIAAVEAQARNWKSH